MPSVYSLNVKSWLDSLKVELKELHVAMAINISYHWIIISHSSLLTERQAFSLNSRLLSRKFLKTLLPQTLMNCIEIISAHRMSTHLLSMQKL